MEEFDLGNVMFIATANYIEQIPYELRDRLEIINVSSYTEYEKLDIAKRHLVPKELEELIMIGSTVLVPFGKSSSLEEGYVVGIKENTTYEVKDIVRYTMVAEPEELVDKTLNSLKALDNNKNNIY